MISEATISRDKHSMRGSSQAASQFLRLGSSMLSRRFSGCGTQESATRNLYYFIGHFFGGQPPGRFVPVRKPQDHTEQTEGRHGDVDVPQLPFLNELPQCIPNQFDVGAFSGVDLPALGRIEAADLF